MFLSKFRGRLCTFIDRLVGCHVVVIMICAFIYGIDHIFFDNGVRGIGIYKRAHAEIVYERKNYRNTKTNLHKEQHGHDGNCGNDSQTYQRQDISLDSENREYQGILEHLCKLDIEGYDHKIGVEAEYDINYYKRDSHHVDQVGKHIRRCIQKVKHIIRQSAHDNTVNNSKYRSLLQVLFDGVEIIGENENTVASYKSANNIYRAHLLPTVRYNVNEQNPADYPVQIRVIEGRKRELIREKSEIK